MPSKIRLNRISERIRQELSNMLLKDIKDPRLVGVYVTDVKVDREISFSDIYVSSIEGHERSNEILQSLQAASGFIRKNLAKSIDLRSFPVLRFHWDPTPENADHIENLFALIREMENPKDSEPSGDNNG